MAFIIFLVLQILDTDYAEIQTHFTQNRSTLPTMYISTPYDQPHSPWTKHKPQAPALQRLILLARESHRILTEQLQKTTLDTDYKVTTFLQTNTLNTIVIMPIMTLKCRSLVALIPALLVNCSLFSASLPASIGCV